MLNYNSKTKRARNFCPKTDGEKCYQAYVAQLYLILVEIVAQTMLEIVIQKVARVRPRPFDQKAGKMANFAEMRLLACAIWACDIRLKHYLTTPS